MFYAYIQYIYLYGFTIGILLVVFI